MPFPTIITGRVVGGTRFRPPWPWPLRRFGEPPEDWEGDGYSQYYGLEFPTEIDIPCEDVCNFMAGSTWKLEGGFSGEVMSTDIYGYPLDSPFIIEDSVSELEAPLGQAVIHLLEYNGSSVEDTITAGTAWHELDSIYELISTQPFLSDPYGDEMVSVSGAHLVTGTSENPPPNTEQDFYIEYMATVYFPELCKNETGQAVWRIKMLGFSVVWDLANPDRFLASSMGLEFVDSDYPEYSKIIEPSSSGFTLKLTVERAEDI